ncbi:hypothetical protein HpBT174_12700 [Helicobacter pylori]
MLSKRIEHSVLSISTSFKTPKTCSKNSTKFVCVRKIIINPLKLKTKIQTRRKNPQKIPKKIYMGVGLYGREKIKWLTREREREGEFLRITIITNC